MNKADANLYIKHIPFDRKIYRSCGWKKTTGLLLKTVWDLCGKFPVKNMSSCLITSAIISRYIMSVKAPKQFFPVEPGVVMMGNSLTKSESKLMKEASVACRKQYGLLYFPSF